MALNCVNPVTVSNWGKNRKEYYDDEDEYMKEDFSYELEEVEA